MGFVQCLLQRRVQFGGGHFAVVQVAVDEVAVYLDHPLDERAVRGARCAVRGVDAAKVAVALAVEKIHAGDVVLHVHNGGVERMLHAAFQRVVVAHAGAAIQRAGCLQGARLHQQRLGKTRLARAGLPYQGQDADD